jgi:rod shape-determining protein MreC
LKIFQNKFFLICLTVAVVLAAIPSTFALMGYRSLARNIVMTVTSPLRWCVNAVGNAVEGYGKYFGSIDALWEENEILREEKESLEERLEEAERLEKENERLRDYLGMKQENPSFTLEMAAVISRESGNYATVLTLNRGKIHGIKENMAVVVKDGIVGYVCEVGLNWSKVSTIIETASSVGAYIPRSQARGIVSGDFNMKSNGTCKLSFMEGEADIAVGDKVYSSGIGSVYPADLLIGEIVEIGQDEYNRMVVATVKPAADFSSPEWVMVITGYEESGE